MKSSLEDRDREKALPTRILSAIRALISRLPSNTSIAEVNTINDRNKQKERVQILFKAVESILTFPAAGFFLLLSSVHFDF